jgi:hypothetical protein
MAYVSLACRAVVGVVFLIALVNKLRSRAQRMAFVAATRRLAPGWLTGLVPAAALAATVATLEASVVVLLAVPVTSAWVFAPAAGLPLVFGIAIVAALRRGERGSCNCFGASTRPLGSGQLVRNLVLAAVAGLGLAAAVTSNGTVDPIGALVAVIAGGVVALVLVAADDIVALFRLPVTTHNR